MMIENGNFKKVRAFDFGDRLGIKMGSTWRIWAKGKPLLVGSFRPRYTYLVTPEICWTLNDQDLIKMLTAEAELAKKNQKRGAHLSQLQPSSSSDSEVVREQEQSTIVEEWKRTPGESQVEPESKRFGVPQKMVSSLSSSRGKVGKEYGGLLVSEDEIASTPLSSTTTIVAPTPEGEAGASRREEGDEEAEEEEEPPSHTVNPSTLFDDKTQAEWFGNIVQNSEADAFKQMVQSANRPSKFVFLLVLVAGIMIGAFMVIFFSGGLSSSATHTAPPSVPTFPTPTPSGGGAGAILRSFLRLG
jgi:hypothetical protein